MPKGATAPGKVWPSGPVPIMGSTRAMGSMGAGAWARESEARQSAARPKSSFMTQQYRRRGMSGAGGLVLAEAGGAAASSTATGAAGGAGGHGGLACAFGDGSGAAADEAVDMAGAGGAGFKGGVGHLLALVKARAAIVAEVFVGGHGVVLMINGDATLNPRSIQGHALRTLMIVACANRAMSLISNLGLSQSAVF
jgi:hypothetical protein